MPSYHAYNHHYFSWLVGGDAELAERDTPTLLPNPTTTRFVTREGAEHGYPTNIVFKAGPGDTAEVGSYCHTDMFRRTLAASSARAITATPAGSRSCCTRPGSGWWSPCR